MRKYDYRETIIAELMDEHAAMLAHPPDTPEIAMRQLVESFDPFKVLPAPPKAERKNHRKNAREDFHFKAAVLLVTMIFDGKGGRAKVSKPRAVEIWLDLRDAHPGTKKARGFDTISDLWKNRNRDYSQPAWDASGKSWADAHYTTLADGLTLLARCIRDDKERLAARVATARAAIPGGQ